MSTEVYYINLLIVLFDSSWLGWPIINDVKQISLRLNNATDLWFIVIPFDYSLCICAPLFSFYYKHQFCSVPFKLMLLYEPISECTWVENKKVGGSDYFSVRNVHLQRFLLIIYFTINYLFLLN